MDFKGFPIAAGAWIHTEREREGERGVGVKLDNEEKNEKGQKKDRDSREVERRQMYMLAEEKPGREKKLSCIYA